MIKETIEYIYNIAENLGKEITDEQVKHLAHILVGIICCSDPARDKMEKSLNEISEIIIEDLPDIFN